MSRAENPTLAGVERIVFGRSALRSGLARELRIAAGLSQREVAEICGTSRIVVWMWESGRSNPSGPRRERYFELLHRLVMDERLGNGRTS